MIIKRGGKPVGRTAEELRRKPVPPRFETFQIDALVPYETCVIGPAVEEKKQLIRDGELVPPTVVVFNEGVLVTDGNNRVRALKELGETQVRCRVREHLEPERREQLERDLRRRIEKGVSWDNLNVVASGDEREAHTLRELGQENSDAWTASLLAMASGIEE